MRVCHLCGATIELLKTSCTACGTSMEPFETGPVNRVAGLEAELSLEDTGEITAPLVADGEPAPLDPTEIETRSYHDGVDGWSELLERTPVFKRARGADPAPDDLPTLDFDDSLELDVEITPRFELVSAAAEDSPEVHALLTLRAQGEGLVDPSRGPVAHVILALDLSASMNHPDKYPMLTSAIEGMLFDLQSGDAGEVLLSIVLFAYGSEVLFKCRPASQLRPRDVLNEIDHSALRFTRYTDVSGALSRAARIAYDSHRIDRALPQRIYLLTDGKPQDIDGARAIMERVKRLPVDVDALAFGADADVGLLQELVSGGRGGTVKHIRSDTLGEAFGRIAEVAQRIVAKRALLRVELQPGVVGGAAYRFRPGRHAYGDEAFERGRIFERDIGTIESGREYSLLFQFRLPPARGAETRIGEVSLRVPGHGGPRVFRRILGLPRHYGVEEPARDAVVAEARQILESIDSDDPFKMLQALKTRRKLYVSERRDPFLVELVDKAILELEASGSLEKLSGEERAALLAHTCTAGTGRPTSRAREFQPR